VKKKKHKLILVAFLLLFSGYVFVKNITYKVPFRADLEFTHQKFIRKMPHTLRFADEQVHFKSPDAYRHFYQELKYHTRNDAYTRQALRNAGKWSINFPTI
jgi:membrane-bound lytic murein transglycosylase D